VGTKDRKTLKHLLSGKTTGSLFFFSSDEGLWKPLLHPPLLHCPGVNPKGVVNSMSSTAVTGAARVGGEGVMRLTLLAPVFPLAALVTAALLMLFPTPFGASPGCVEWLELGELCFKRVGNFLAMECPSYSMCDRKKSPSVYFILHPFLQTKGSCVV
jgi:hypothetical protein